MNMQNQRDAVLKSLKKEVERHKEPTDWLRKRAKMEYIMFPNAAILDDEQRECLLNLCVYTANSKLMSIAIKLNLTSVHDLFHHLKKQDYGTKTKKHEEIQASGNTSNML